MKNCDTMDAKKDSFEISILLFSSDFHILFQYKKHNSSKLVHSKAST